jgi:phosphomannomutase
MAGIFKAYDVRGVYGDVLNKEIGYQIGLAWANFIGSGKKVLVGRDERSSSPELQTAFIEGVRDGGAHVTNIGLCTTPMTYFACDRGGFDGATMITASHNPGKYNGLKFCRERAIPVGYAEGIDKMEAAIEAGNLIKAEARGDYEEADVKAEYLSFLGQAYRADKKFHFAVDAGNGMGGFLIQDVLDVLKQDAHALYWDLDFSFPNHEANPLDFNTLRDLQASVRDQGLDFGVAFDGDADRCFFVDDLGEVVPADILTALLAVHYLEKTGPSSIVYDIRSSRVVAEQIKAKGGEPVLCRVGHSFMKAKLRETGGVFGGELAGHFYFRDFFFADGAFYTMIQVMNILAEQGKKLSELIAPFKIYFPSGEINFETDKADELIASAPEVFPGGEISTIDGIRLDFEDWWLSLRKSNTEPLLRLVLEGTTQTVLETKVTEVKKWLLDSGAVVKAGH